MVEHRYNTRFAAKRSARQHRMPPEAPKRQLTLMECARVVKLKTSPGCFTLEDLQEAKTTLENVDASPGGLIKTLGTLASLEIENSHLQTTQLTSTVARVAQHENVDVAQTARRLYEKWQQLLAGSDEENPIIL
ncbi:hypothetical protein BSKO_09948 [Bryopsis sp. KO-2023]|nr:hypothetical protein BSKO_09948 [Bryopsis sp. KO-2023]